MLVHGCFLSCKLLGYALGRATGCDWDRCFYSGYCELNLNGRAEDCGAVDIMKVKKSRGNKNETMGIQKGPA